MMQLDRQTLDDLDILGTPSGAPGLLGHLDRTRTRGGRDAFRRRLVQPLGSIEAIRGTQDLLRYIAAGRGHFDPLPDELETAELTRYIDSRFSTVSRVAGPSLAFEAWWIRLRYPDLYNEARRGTRWVQSFLSRIGGLLEAMDDAPESAATILGEMRELLGEPPLQRLRREIGAVTTPVQFLLRDHAARETGRQMLHRLIELTFELDALVSMADVMLEKGYVFPVVEDETSDIDMRGVYHPFLDDPVENDADLSDEARLLFLTGPNMAGKTTYLKATGIAVLLAHTGMGVPARAGRLGRVDRMITAIRTADDLRNGVSYFQQEARRVRDMAESLAEGSRCVILVDELFRGTNVKDACDASLIVLRAFAGARNGRFVVASHLIELAPLLEDNPGVVLRHFAGDISGRCPAFDYQLRAGVSSQRLGMLVLESEGVVEVLDAILSSRRFESQE